MNIKKNLKFISHLRKNARLTLTQLSKKTSKPISTLHEKLKNNYIIKKHTCLLDFKELGYTTWATIFLKVASKDRYSLYDMLKKHENVNSSYKIASNYDVMIECIFENIGCVNEFIESIEKKYEILSKEVHFIIEDINRENFLTQTELIIN